MKLLNTHIGDIFKTMVVKELLNAKGKLESISEKHFYSQGNLIVGV